MKKIKVNIIILLLFFIIYFMQANFFSWFNIGGIMPNLFVLLILIVGLFVGNKLGVIFGIIFGIILDLIIGKSIGLTSILYAIVGFIGEYLDKNFSKNSRATLIIMAIVSTMFYEIVNYIFCILFYKIDMEIIEFSLTLFIELVFNSLLIIILYPIIKKIGYYLEDAYKGKKILTRYF